MVISDGLPKWPAGFTAWLAGDSLVGRPSGAYSVCVLPAAEAREAFITPFWRLASSNCCEELPAAPPVGLGAWSPVPGVDVASDWALHRHMVWCPHD